jgi:hypothetical protein
MTISSMHPLFAWSLVHSSWIHNRYVVRAGQTAYELCSARMYGGKIALFGESVMGFLRTSQKSAPSWTRGLWLGKTLNNDAHMIGVPGDGGKVFITRSIRRFPQPWDPQLIADFEACPWQFGLVGLGSQLVAAKRITGPQPSTPVPFAALDFSNDPDARAVMGIPGTPDDDEAIVMAPAKVPRQSLPPPVQAAVASEAGQPSDFGCGHG